MKRIAENRYPHSATLFRFCKNALEIRYQGNVKVIDQDVGAILGFDPADCSHWKKGKKNIRSLSTIRAIAEHLKIDDRLLIDIAFGKTDLNEALFEFKGYGNFALQGTHLETLKKEFFKEPQKWQKKEGAFRSFEELFHVNKKDIEDCVKQVLGMGHFHEAPIYLPELYQLFPRLTLETAAYIDNDINVETSGAAGEFKMHVRIKALDMKPHTRFLAAKQLFIFLVESKNPIAAKFFDQPAELLELQGNLFAGILLIPSNLLSAEMKKLNCAFDVVDQLANIFWVSKALVNKRLADYLD